MTLQTLSLASMTGFARISGAAGDCHWIWELKSVNGRGLDIKLRIPSVLEQLDIETRGRLAKALQRGTIQVQLTLTRPPRQPVVRINGAVLDRLVDALKASALGSAMSQVDPALLLQVKGVVDIEDAADDTDALLMLVPSILNDLDRAIVALCDMRKSEGLHLMALLEQRLATIADLVQRADVLPGRQPEAIRARLSAQIALLTGIEAGFDQTRLMQEALIMAAKADIREELDRLAGHVSAARLLLVQGGAAGRKLDFLCQEFTREANTLCAKSNDTALTAIGLDLKAVIEQFREQVQNIE